MGVVCVQCGRGSLASCFLLPAVWHTISSKELASKGSMKTLLWLEALMVEKEPMQICLISTFWTSSATVEILMTLHHFLTDTHSHQNLSLGKNHYYQWCSLYMHEDSIKYNTEATVMHSLFHSWRERERGRREDTISLQIIWDWVSCIWLCILSFSLPLYLTCSHYYQSKWSTIQWTWWFRWFVLRHWLRIRGWASGSSNHSNKR